VEQTVRVTAVEERSEFDAVSATIDPQKNLVQELGIIGVEIDPRIASAAKGLRDPLGIIVMARAAGATSDVPLQARDVIRSLNNRPTPTLYSLRELLKALKPGSPVTLQIQREGRLMYVSFTID
jgi:S1-C subfamily serine protease